MKYCAELEPLALLMVVTTSLLVQLVTMSPGFYT